MTEVMPRQEMERDLERLHPAAFGWALACCRREPEEAEEVLQRSYLKVLDGQARFAGRSSLKTWFLGVIRRTAAEQRRSSFLRGRALAGWFRRNGDLPQDPSPLAAAERSDEGDRLRRALATLPARQRSLLHLVFYQELTLTEAAQVLGVRPGTASTHYKRGKERLRALLETGSGP